MEDKVKNRFKDKFVICRNSECWEWRGQISYNGESLFWYKGKTLRAHRISYEIYISKIPVGLCVLHKCNNQRCVNPKHLFLATRKNIAQDVVKKGRHCGFSGSKHQIGSKHPRAKITENDVIEIRKMGKRNILHAEIAKKFNVSRNCIRRVLYRQGWKHVK